MTKKIKLAIVVGTRPEIVRLSRVIPLAMKKFDVFLIHTGQNYDPMLSQVFFDELKLPAPNVILECAGTNSINTIANVLSETDRIFQEIKPDALLILGDTNSCLSALSAKRQRIPIFHMEAGNRCFDMRVPEEINRKIVDHLADIDMPYSTIARSFLIDEGFPKDQIIKTGSPLNEVLMHYDSDIDTSKIMEQLNLEPHKFFLVSAHREENIDSDSRVVELFGALNQLTLTYQLPVIVSVHPRLRERLERQKLSIDKQVLLHEPFGLFDYCKLQKNAKVVLSDSGTITEEAAILGFDGLNLRETHERHEGMEETSVLMVGTGTERILQGIEILEGRDRLMDKKRSVLDYDVVNVSEKVIRIIVSYIDYANRKTWQR